MDWKVVVILALPFVVLMIASVSIVFDKQQTEID